MWSTGIAQCAWSALDALGVWKRFPTVSHSLPHIYVAHQVDYLLGIKKRSRLYFYILCSASPHTAILLQEKVGWGNFFKKKKKKRIFQKNAAKNEQIYKVQQNVNTGPSSHIALQGRRLAALSPDHHWRVDHPLSLLELCPVCSGKTTLNKQKKSSTLSPHPCFISPV